MTQPPFQHLPRQGVVAVNSPAYLRQMLGNLSLGIVSVPLRMSGDRERLERSGATQVVVPAQDHGWLEMDFTSKGALLHEAGAGFTWRVQHRSWRACPSLP